MSCYPQAGPGRSRRRHMGSHGSVSLLLGSGLEGLLPSPVPGVQGDPGPAASHPPWASRYICKVGGGRAERREVGLAKLIKIRTNFLSGPPCLPERVPCLCPQGLLLTDRRPLPFGMTGVSCRRFVFRFYIFSCHFTKAK